jgi:L-threonylcarbamoyladenylate synthase
MRRRLIAALGFPITGTSANRAGGRPLVRADDVAREFGDHLELILEAGPCPGGLPSTIGPNRGRRAWSGPGDSAEHWRRLSR